ncbi:hypothetical protein ACJBYU_11075, partial [Streptococcus suis]
RNFAGARAQLAWDFPDPKSRIGNNPFATTLNELNNRLSMFLMIETTQQNISLSDDASTFEQVLTIDPVSFYKCLTDNIRLKTLMLTNYYGELCV